MFTTLRFLTAGESHGKGLVALIEGMPSGLSVSEAEIDRDLRRRQQGHGRGGRMKIEQDHAEIISGVRWGKTIGSPIALLIANRDWKNWQEGMSAESVHKGSIPAVTRPRPGHADLAGSQKYDHQDVRNILERSSARETAARVAAGAVARALLAAFGIRVGSHVVRIGSASWNDASIAPSADLSDRADVSPVRCPDEDASSRMVAEIDDAMAKGDSVGGVFTVVVEGVPAGLGSHAQWDRRLNARLMMALGSIQAIKGVEVGIGFRAGELRGSEVMDEIIHSGEIGYGRASNNAGGIEGGISNGMPIVLRAVMKPIPTLRRPLRSVDMASKSQVEAAYERSDVCAVPAASVVGEAMAALCIADALLTKFGGDSIQESIRNFEGYRGQLRAF